MKMRITLATVYGVCGFFLALVAAGCMDATTTLEMNHMKLLIAGVLFLIMSLIEIGKIVKTVKED